MLHFASAKRDGDQDLVVMLKKLPRLVHFGLYIVVARLWAHADLLHLLLMDLFTLVALLRILKTHLAIIEDAADRRTLIGCHLNQVELGLFGLRDGQRGNHHAQLFPLDANQADRADADLLVDSWATVWRRLLIEMTNTWISFKGGTNRRPRGGRCLLRYRYIIAYSCFRSDMIVLFFPFL